MFLNKDGTVRVSNPFDRNGEIPQLYLEVLAYFEHLRKHPRKAATMSKILAAKMLLATRDVAKATTILEDVIKDARPRVAELAAADRKAADAEDGYHLRRLWRPEYEAWSMLAAVLGRTDPGRPADLMLELSGLVSPAGQCWRVNEIAADYALKAGREEAKKQFQLAANGLKDDIAQDGVREGKIERSPLPPGVTERPPSALERKLKKVQEKQKLVSGVR